MLYLQAAYFQALRYFTYPMEIVGGLIKRTIEVGYLVLFWYLVAQGSAGAIDTKEIVAYILITGSVSGLASSSSLYFGGMISEHVKLGTISNYLIKPVRLIPYLYATFVGTRAVTMAMALVTLVLGIWLSPAALTGKMLVLFAAYFALAFLIITAISVLLGVVAFYTTEATMLRYSMGHVIRLLSGALVPLSFFPEAIRTVILWSPFPVTLYGPASVFAPSLQTMPHSQMLAIGAGWSVLLWLLAGWLWRRALRNYDAVGL